MKRAMQFFACCYQDAFPQTRYQVVFKKTPKESKNTDKIPLK